RSTDPAGSDAHRGVTGVARRTHQTISLRRFERARARRRFPAPAVPTMVARPTEGGTHRAGVHSKPHAPEAANRHATAGTQPHVDRGFHPVPIRGGPLNRMLRPPGGESLLQVGPPAAV